MDDAQTLLMSQIRGKAHEQNFSQDTIEKIEENIYVKVEREDWGEVLDNLDRIEEEHGLDMSKQRSLVKRLRSPDALEGVEEDSDAGKAPEEEKLVIEKQVKETESDEIIAKTDEGIGVDHLRNLTEHLYRDYGKKTFFISDQNTWNGRVAVELAGTKEKFELLAVYEDKDSNKYFKHFGQKNPNKGYNLIEKLTEGFYKYKFISDDEEFIALSREKLDTSRCEIHGTKISLNDYDPVGEVLKLAVDRDVIFVHSVEPAIQELSSEELDDFRSRHSHDDLAQHLLGEWRQPEWFERFLLADILVLDENGFPSHLIWPGPPGTGKSKVIESAVKALDEPQKQPFTGSGSTVKGLVPSFKESPPEEGYLLKSQRVAGVDEKMDLLSNSVQNSNSHQTDVFRPLLNLLTHDTRNFESGNGSIKGEMESVMWSAGNLDAYGISDMKDLADKIDDAYLSRCIIYNQTESHIEFIDDRKAEIKNKMQRNQLKEEDLFPEPDDKFISVVDTMRERHAIIDHRKVKDVFDDLQDVVPGYMKAKYRARYQHHMTNILSGLTKYRYLIGEKDSLEAGEEDYEEMRSIFETIISGWGDVDMQNLSEEARKRALRPPERNIYNIVEENPGITTKELGQRGDVDDLARSVKKLRDVDLVVAERRDDEKRLLWPYWSDEAEELNEDVIV